MPVCNGLSTNGLSSICALSCTILVHIFSYFTLSRYTFFMLHFFHFTLSMLLFFHFALFSCCTFLTLRFPCCTFFILKSFPVALFLQNFHFVPSSCSFFHVTLSPYCAIFILLFFALLSFHVALFRVSLLSCCTFYLLHSSVVALFSCCTFSLLHSSLVALFSCCNFFSLDFQFWLVWCCSYYMVHFSLLYFPHAAHISRCTLPCSIHFMLQLFPAVIFVLFWYRSLFTFFCFYATFFSLLCLSRDTFHNLQRLIQLDYNPHSIII